VVSSLLILNLAADSYRRASTKGQLIPKADWSAIDSPKKRTDEFDLFDVKSKKANKPNLSFHFLGESMECQSAFEIN
jgi:hypothetical protein